MVEQHYMRCPDCDGQGKKDESKKDLCRHCYGSGKRYVLLTNSAGHGWQVLE